MEWLGGEGEGGQDLALGPGEGGLYGVKRGSGGLRKGWQGWDGVLVWLQSVPPDLTSLLLILDLLTHPRLTRIGGRQVFSPVAL